MPMDMKKTKDEIQWEMIQNRFLSYDQEKFIRIFNLEHDEDQILITFLGRDYKINRKTGLMFDGERQASIDETVSVYELLTNSEHAPVLTGKWESVASLCTNTTDTSLGRYIEYLKPFQDNIELMQSTLISMGAEPQKKGDVSAILTVFPNVPVWFQYWAADDEFPASIQFLFDAGIAEHFRWSLLWNLMTMITDRMLETAGLEQ
ncbi:MAG: DUF3786 domain-containing protein [Lachnospiraceae bacterium]|nr:DUF3786 domain-containing protein [Lachnospiraceae bacterium]